jgi:hypothetical protein
MTCRVRASVYIVRIYSNCSDQLPRLQIQVIATEVRGEMEANPSDQLTFVDAARLLFTPQEEEDDQCG